MSKKRFSTAERYAVWFVHEKRCWLCRRPLEFIDTAIDHVLPESLLDDPAKLGKVLSDLGLPRDFNINGPENWLPCHRTCNEQKADSHVNPPVVRYLLDRMARRVPEVKRQVAQISDGARRGSSVARLLVAIEQGQIAPEQLRQLGLDLSPAAVMRGVGIVLLEDGHWVFQKDVAYEGLCECERTSCVDCSERVLCVFPNTLSAWVIAKRLYWKCYDEAIVCPRCSQLHKRGHIGSTDPCRNPYRDQVAQLD